jgi:hypothetical protein
MNLSFASIEYRPLARHPPSVAEAEDSAEALLSGRPIPTWPIDPGHTGGHVASSASLSGCPRLSLRTRDDITDLRQNRGEDLMTTWVG